jgi:cell division protein FtsL
MNYFADAVFKFNNFEKVLLIFMVLVIVVVIAYFAILPSSTQKDISSIKKLENKVTNRKEK